LVGNFYRNKAESLFSLKKRVHNANSLRVDYQKKKKKRKKI
jgi:hypothetical protein